MNEFKFDAGAHREYSGGLMEYLGASPKAGLPMLYLPDDWTPSHALSLGSIRSAVAQGVGLYFPPDMPQGFDLAWIADELPFARALLFPAAIRNIVNIGYLEDALLVEEISTPEMGSIDPRKLTSVRHVALYGSGYSDLLQAPQLLTAVVDIPEVGVRTRLSSSIQSLSITSKLVDLQLLGDVPNLRTLAVYGSRSLDLASLELVPKLQELVITDCGCLIRVNRLEGMSHLSALKLFRVSRIISVKHLAKLRSLDLRSLEIFNCPDVDMELAALLSGIRETWSVSAGKNKQSSSRFVIVPRSDGRFELVFDDFERVQRLLSDSDSLTEIDGDEIESILTHVAQRNLTKAPGYEFDSEADAIIAVVERRSDATKLQKLWDPIFLDRESFEAAAQPASD